MKRLALPVMTIACLLGPNVALAARMEDLHATRNLDEINKQHGPTPATVDAAAKARRHAELLGVPADSTLAPLRAARKDKIGSYYRYQQLFQGVPVYGADMALSEDPNGNLRTAFGQLALGLGSDLTSTAANLSPQQAIGIAKRSALIGQYANTPTEHEQAKKMIYIDDDGGAHVVYQTSFFIAHPSTPIAPTMFIDANTAEILKEWDSLMR